MPRITSSFRLISSTSGRAGDAEVLRMHEHHRVRRVDEAVLIGLSFHLDGVLRVSGGQELSGSRALGRHKLQHHSCRRARHTVDGEIALGDRAAILHRDLLDDLFIGVGVPDMDLSHGLHRFHQPLVDGVGPHGGGDVSAVHGLSDDRVEHVHLAEGVVDVDAGTLTLFYDRHLGGGGVGAAHAVDLAPVRGTKGGKDHLVPLHLVLRQILIQENHGL